MTLFEKVQMAAKQFILNAKSPWRFFALWMFLTLEVEVTAFVLAYWVYCFLGLTGWYLLAELLICLFFVFLVWEHVISVFNSPELRFWSLRKCLQKPEVSGLDLEKIKSKHIEYLHLIDAHFFLTLVYAIGTLAIGLIGGLVILFL